MKQKDFVVKVETALPSDAPEMAEIERRWSLASLPSNAMAETGALFRILGAERLVEVTSMSTAICLVARGEEGIDGFFLGYRKTLALEIYPTLPSDSAPDDAVWEQDFTYIKTVAVRSDLIGRGIGTQLVNAFRDVAIRINCPYALAEISVAPLENSRSISLFRSTLAAIEIGRHTATSSGITWGLFKSELLIERSKKR